MTNKIGTFTSKNGVVDLGKIYPISKIEFNTSLNQEILVSPDMNLWFKSNLYTDKSVDFNNKTTRYIKVDCCNEYEIIVYLGTGYIATDDSEWSNLFSRDEYWTGADGFFTFNLKGGKEAYDMEDDEVKTLCVFGDTLSSTLHPETKQRMEPMCMPNSTIAIIDGSKPNPAKTEFKIRTSEKGHCESYLEPTTELAYKGTLAAHLVREGYDSDTTPWMTTYYPKEVGLEFDLNKSYELSHIDIYNYFYESNKDLGYQNRGIKYLDIYYSNDNMNFEYAGKYELSIADFNEKGQNYTRIPLNGINAQYFKFETSNEVGVGNFGGVNGKEAVFGLNKVRFCKTDNFYLNHVSANASSEWAKSSKYAWYWLQDGVYVDGNLYFFPLIVIEDLTAPEGFQFAIDGISMIKVPVENNEPNFDLQVQSDTNLFRKIDGRDWYWGAAFYANTVEASAVNPDGYIYIYGYTFKFEEIDYGRRLRVARVKPSELENINEWRYYNGTDWTPNMEDATVILDHVSCEMSISHDNGKYVAVFTYDVQTPYVAYAIGDTLYSGFSEPNIVYVCGEKGDKVYHYNAKAHPHLSNKDRLLVSYNVNTASMDENMADGKIYRPRFIRLNYQK